MGSRNSSFRVNHGVPSQVLFVCDATKDRNNHEFYDVIHNLREMGVILKSGDTIVVLGVLHRILHAMGYHMGVLPESFLGTTHTRAMEEEVSKKIDLYVHTLQKCAKECEAEGVNIEVKIIAGTPMRKVVVREVALSNATWVILDRHLRKELRFYLRNIATKVALVLDNSSLEVLRPYTSNKEIEYIEDALFYSQSKRVLPPPVQVTENNEQCVISVSYSASMSSPECSAMAKKLFSSLASNSKEHKSSPRDESNPMQEKSVIPKQRRKSSGQKSSNVPVLCIGCGVKTDMDSRRYSYTELQAATNDFSSDNLLGKNLVYKGVLKDGQLIAAKVQKVASTKGFEEFFSELSVLSLARHKNIMMLLGFCCKEDINILVYEYICNKSLKWHLFDNKEHVLEWNRRYSIAIGIAKGLRFLHEECRGSPIVHQDVQPGNILLTHDFVPMLGDFGLAKWKTNEDDIRTSILTSHGYHAPEYAENSILSVQADVYAFGIVLIQLISGRSATDSQQPPLRQWALPLIKTLSFHELADPRLGDSYNTSELYHMARTAFLCIQTEPKMRPSMAEALSLLEGESDHFQHLTEQFIPHFSK